MPYMMPTDGGWSAADLLHGRYVTVFEVWKDPDDDEWDEDSDPYVEDRRAFWSEEDGDGLMASLNTGTPWIHPGRLRKVSRIQSSAGDLRSWGTIGLQAKFQVEIANEDGLLEDMQTGPTGGYHAGARNKERTSPWENRWARIGLLAYNPSGSLAYPGSVLWLGCGRITKVAATSKSWKITVEDDRLQAKLDVPRTIYRNDESDFAGFRAESSIHGKVKPWLFGHVPIAAGKTVVLGYEDTADLRGRFIEFFAADESWQSGGTVSGLQYGHADLVDATWTRGLLEINDETGGWVSTRSDYTATSNGRGFFFDNFNEQYLYLKMDVRFTYADLKRDTGAVAGITNAGAILDPSVNSYAVMPDTAAVFGDWVAIPLPFPSFGSFDMRIEGILDGSGSPDGWQSYTGADNRNMYPGFYVFLKATELVANLGTDGGVFVNIAAFSGGSYLAQTAYGPARYWWNPGADLDNFQGDRDLYRMYQRNNTTANVAWGGAPSTTQELGMRQGNGWILIAGVQTKAGTAEGAGVRWNNVGVRLWGRIEFPDDGFYADAYGYPRTGTMLYATWSVAGVNDTFVTPLGILGLFLRYVLPTQGPRTAQFYLQDTWFDGHGFEVGKQLATQTDAFDEIDQLCQDSHVMLTGACNLAREITGHLSDFEGHRATFLPKLGQAAHRFNDTGTRVLPTGSADGLEDTALGAFESGVVPGTVEPYRGRLDDVFTRFVYKYRFNPMRDEFDGVATISPSEWELGEYMVDVAGTWLDQTTMQARLAAARDAYRRDPELATLTYEATWVHDGATAEYLLAFLATNASKPRHGVKLETGMLPLYVRLGDPVEVDLKDLPREWVTKFDALEEGEEERLYIVAGKDVDPEKGRIAWDLMEVTPLERLSYVFPW